MRLGKRRLASSLGRFISVKTATGTRQIARRVGPRARVYSLESLFGIETRSLGGAAPNLVRA